ncbi:hydroxyacylglutathione hydrolase [Wenzhouxiangella sp. XN201]|uniref:hydroxyacylglutathione hydrolase n=1 Tax=Wenzhouxiangella sp. XN201 TaxID=2710755 RepID=UPI0013CDC6E4|nr:hydroxyacylglutathione hydrolase [Wenzhouxiangella sp. XN201]NEZ05075.1 hydroxyacylglutathione hydrolase [Wenzhouxiangella sp. XN201]
MPLSIDAIPTLETNYVWALHDGRHALLVDPGEAGPPLAWLAENELQLAALLITHHHWDHTDGIDDIIARHPVPVYGPDDLRIPQVDHPLREGDHVEIDSPRSRFEILSVPGHTSIHLAYFGHRLVLCGDTLFSAGCGRLFEGTPEQMLASLDKLADLPGDTRVFCAHEYTVANCRFALAVEPDNQDLKERLHEVETLRENGKITLPSNIGAERRFNPFLRAREPGVIKAVQEHDPGCGTEPVEIFAALRRWKDNF